MSVTKAAKYATGDRIVHTGWGGGCGVVVKPAKSSVLVRLDGRIKDERLWLDVVRPETATDVAKREHDKAMRAWRDQRPSVQRVSVTSPSYGGSEPTGASIFSGLNSPGEMRAAADELRLIADWFEQKPGDALPRPNETKGR